MGVWLLVANLRDIRNRIKSVKSTEKITRAMKMVAAAKLRRAQEAAMGATPYQRKIDMMLKTLSQSISEVQHPLLQVSKLERQILIVISSDRGLCGGFNNNLFKRVHAFLNNGAVDTDLILVGKKSVAQFGNKGLGVLETYETFWPDFNHAKSKGVYEAAATAFLKGEVQAVHIAYNTFESVMSQTPTIKKLLPMVWESESTEADLQENTKEKPNAEIGMVHHEFKPSKETILKALLPKAVMGTFYNACLHSRAGEYGARMTSMDSASRNASDMIDELTLKMNRVRQAAITSELVEIISGAEAIK